MILLYFCLRKTFLAWRQNQFCYFKFKMWRSSSSFLSASGMSEIVSPHWNCLKCVCVCVCVSTSWFHWDYQDIVSREPLSVGESSCFSLTTCEALMLLSSCVQLVSEDVQDSEPLHVSLVSFIGCWTCCWFTSSLSCSRSTIQSFQMLMFNTRLVSVTKRDRLKGLN